MEAKQTDKPVSSDKTQKTSSEEELEALRRRVDELEKQVLQAEIRTEAYDEMINVAETMFGIPIRKKIDPTSKQ